MASGLMRVSDQGQGHLLENLQQTPGVGRGLPGQLRQGGAFLLEPTDDAAHTVRVKTRNAID